MLSHLVRRAAAGETVVTCLGRYAVAQLSSLDVAAPSTRRLGLLKGKLVVPADFDSPLPEEVLADFEGKS